MYKNRNAKTTPGKTQPIMGTKIADKYEVLAKTVGKKDAAIVKGSYEITLQFKMSLLQILPNF